MEGTLMKRLLLLLACFIIFVRCGDLGGGVNTKGIDQRVAMLETTIQSLEKGLSDLELARKRSGEGEINVTERSYTRITSKTGFFLVSCEDIQPYLDGYRVKLQIGNPYAVTFSGCQILAKWGAKFDPQKMTYDDWQKGLKTKNFALTSDLRPATWNRVTITITPATPSDLKYFSVGLKTDSVKMSVGD
jgi:hypothetical protein